MISTFTHIELSVKDARVLCDAVQNVHWLSSGRKIIGFGAFHTLEEVPVGNLAEILLEKWNPGIEFAYRNMKGEVIAKILEKKAKIYKGWNFVGAYLEPNGMPFCFYLPFERALESLQDHPENNFCVKLISDLQEIQKLTRGMDLSDRLGIL